MSLPTVAVTCAASDQGGPAVAFGVYTAKLDQTEIYNGFVVPEQITATADAEGVAVLNLWPNALGVAGSMYRITARNPDTGKKFLDANVVVPNAACNLHQILVQEPYPAIDAAQQAVVDTQAALAAAQAQAVLADDDRVAAEIAAAQALTRSAAAALSQLNAGLAEIEVEADRVEVAAIADQFGMVQSAVTSATAQASVATTQAGIALTQAELANAARVLAEAARNAATTVGKVFTSTALGIAGTTSGQSFSVLSADLQDLIVYTNPSTTEVFRLKTKAFFDTVFANGFTATRTGYLYAWVDSVGALLLGIKLDGTLWSKSNDLTTGVADLQLKVFTGPTRSNYLHVFTDSTNAILGGILTNGDLEIKGLNHSAALSSVPAAVALSQPIKSIAIFGDSLTEGAGSTGGLTFGAQLQALYAAAGDTRTVYSSGLSGQGGSSILQRQGSAPALITFPVGASGFPEIPAAGAVNVTITGSILQYADTSAKSITGSIAGIPGTLNKAVTTGQYSFTRTTAGGITKVDAGVPFNPAADQYRYWTLGCWIGTNNMLDAGTAADVAAKIMGYIQTYVGWQVTTEKWRFVGMPAINCVHANVANILAVYDALLPLVKAAYPYDYIDTRALLQRNHDGSANDLADIAAGLPPRSLLFTDRYHLNNAGYGVMAAEAKRLNDIKGH